MAYLKSKKTAIVLTAVAVVLALSAAVFLTTSATQNEPGDFKGMKWGADLHGLSGMKLLAEDGDVRFYQKENDEMKVGGAEVGKIVYGFHKGRFYSVVAYFGNPAAYASMKETFSREYGEPIQTDQNAKKCFWNGDIASVLLTYDDASNAGRIALFFKPIQLEVEMSRPNDPQ